MSFLRLCVVGLVFSFCGLSGAAEYVMTYPVPAGNYTYVPQSALDPGLFGVPVFVTPRVRVRRWGIRPWRRAIIQTPGYGFLHFEIE